MMTTSTDHLPRKPRVEGEPDKEECIQTTTGEHRTFGLWKGPDPDTGHEGVFFAWKSADDVYGPKVFVPALGVGRMFVLVKHDALQCLALSGG